MYMSEERRKSLGIARAIFIIVLAISSDVLLRFSIEDSARQQARYNLQQIKYCYSRVSKVMDMIPALETCTAKSRVGFSGDVYVLDADTKEFIVENSSDVPGGAMYFTKESVGKYFKDWNTADIAIKQIMLGKDSEVGTGVSYLFDNDIEWLEWKYLPDATKYTNDRRLIVVQGVQSNEAVEQFRVLERIGFLFAGILVFMLLVLHNVQVSYKNRRWDDRQRK
jgi:hypothetical protein